MPVLRLVIVLIMISHLGCSLFVRKETTELKDARAYQEKFKEAGSDYTEAQQHFEKKEFEDSAKKFKSYIDQFPGFPHFDEAEFYLGQSLYHLKDYDEAAIHSRNVIQRSTDLHLTTESRILLAKILEKKGNLEEGLALTYDLLPDELSEKNSGLRRKSYSPELTVSEKARLFLIRAGILNQMGRDRSARRAVLKTKNYLKFGHFVDPKEKQELQAHWSKLAITMMTDNCKKKYPLPEQLSEDVFLDFSEHYYSCLAPSRKMLCDALQSDDENLQKDTINIYKAAAFWPKQMVDQVPPPTITRKAKMKWPEQKSFFENEIRGLMQNTIDRNIQRFKDIEVCHAFNIFDGYNRKGE